MGSARNTVIVSEYILSYDGSVSFFDAFCISQKRSLKVFWSQTAREKAHQYGAKVFKDLDSAQKYCQQIHGDAMYLEQLKIADVDAEVFKTFIYLAKNFLYSYIVLDPEFTNDLEILRDDQKVLSYLGMEKNNLREKVNELFFTDQSVYVKLLNAIAQKLNIEAAHLHNTTVEKIYSSLAYDSNSEIYTKQDYIIWSKDAKVYYEFDTEIINTVWERFMDMGNNMDANVLSGDSVAKKGIYKGTVRILHMSYTNLDLEIERLNQQQGGFVLVADHTTPEIVPLMKKSIAIVTNMGGILSHAAITARELDLPCIVGTQIATQSLKDGDTVTVDAERGVVSIINNI